METFVGDTINLGIRTYTDVSVYSINRIYYAKPDGSTGYWEASADPSDVTRMQVTLADGELDISGTWLAQAYIEEGGESFHGLWAEFKVFKPLPIR
jgi:hypothetical protein